jgi:aldehyde dehydrogenase family 7 protein A1
MNHLVSSIRLISKPAFTYKFIRMSSTYLINDPKYSFLKELGLSEKNHGVFARHGKWSADGEVRKTIFFSLL